MANKELTSKEWEEYVKKFWQEVIRSLTRERGEATKLAKALCLQRATISDIRTGRSSGSSTVNLRMLFMLAGIPDYDAKKILENPQLLVKNLESGLTSQVDNLFFELKNLYSENELAAWLKLLISKRNVEKNIGVSLKASLKNKSPKKKKL